MPMILRSARRRSNSSPPALRRSNSGVLVDNDNDVEQTQSVPLPSSPQLYPTLASPPAIDYDFEDPLDSASRPESPDAMDTANTVVPSLFNEIVQHLAVSMEHDSSDHSFEEFGHEFLDNANGASTPKAADIDPYDCPSDTAEFLQLLLRASVPLPGSIAPSVTNADDTPIQPPAELNQDGFRAPKKTNRYSTQLTTHSSPSPPSKGKVNRYSFGTAEPIVTNSMDVGTEGNHTPVDEPPVRMFIDDQPCPISLRKRAWLECRQFIAQINAMTPNNSPMKDLDYILSEAYKLLLPQTRREVVKRYKMVTNMVDKPFDESFATDTSKVKSEKASNASDSIHANVATHATLQYGNENPLGKDNPFTTVPLDYTGTQRPSYHATVRTASPTLYAPSVKSDRSSSPPIGPRRSKLPTMAVLQNRSLTSRNTQATYGEGSTIWEIPKRSDSGTRPLSPVASNAHDGGVSNPRNYFSPHDNASTIENIVPLRAENISTIFNKNSKVDTSWLEGTAAAYSPPSIRQFERRAAREQEDIRREQIKHDKFAYPLPRFSAKLHLKEPSAYSGEADAHRFELWTYQVNNFFGMANYPEHMCVRMIGSYLTGKASRWYMLYVAPAPEEYTIERIGKELFNYCFPDDLRRKLRKQFDTFNQGTRKLADYVQELKTLGSKIPDINERHICIRLFEGSIDKIRLRWIENGMTGEYTSLADLENTGRQYENAIREAARLEREMTREYSERRSSKLPAQYQNKRHGYANQMHAGNRYSPNKQKVSYSAQRYNNRDSPRRPYARNSEYNNRQSYSDSRASNSTTLRRPDDRNRNHNGAQRRPDDRRPPSGGRNNNHAPFPKRPENLDELRAQNLCFKCKKAGHLARDCPDDNVVRAPNNPRPRNNNNSMRFGSATLETSRVQFIPTTAKSNSDVITAAPLYFRDGLAFDTNSPTPLNKPSHAFGGFGYIPMTPDEVTDFVKERDRKAVYEAYRQIRHVRNWNKYSNNEKMSIIQWNGLDGTLHSLSTRCEYAPDPLQIKGLPQFAMEDLKQVDGLNYFVYRYLYRTELYLRYEERDGDLTLYLRRSVDHLPIVEEPLEDDMTTSILEKGSRHWPLDVPTVMFPMDRLRYCDTWMETNTRPKPWFEKSRFPMDRKTRTEFGSKPNNLVASHLGRFVRPIRNLSNPDHSYRVPCEHKPHKNRGCPTFTPKHRSTPVKETILGYKSLVSKEKRKVSFARNEPNLRSPIFRVPTRTPDCPGPSSLRMNSLSPDNANLPVETVDTEMTEVDPDEYFYTDEVYDEQTAVDSEIPELLPVSDSSEGSDTESTDSAGHDSEVEQTVWGSVYLRTRGLNNEHHDMDYMAHLMRMLHINASLFGMNGAHWFVEIPNSPRFGWESHKDNSIILYDYLTNMEHRFDYDFIRYSHLHKILHYLEYFTYLRRDELAVLEPELPFQGPEDPSDHDDPWVSGIPLQIQEQWNADKENVAPEAADPRSDQSISDFTDLGSPSTLDTFSDSDPDPPIPSSSSVTLQHPIFARESTVTATSELPNLGWQQVMGDPAFERTLINNGLVIQHETEFPFLPIIPELTESDLEANNTLRMAAMTTDKHPSKVPMSKMPSTARGVNRTSLRVKDSRRIVPKVYTVEVLVNGEVVNALLDSGCQADVISKRLCDQLKLKLDKLENGPVNVLLASQGSRAVLENSTTVDFKFLQINRRLKCDVLGLDPAYDIILGTPFIWQHSLMIGLNPCRVIIDSVEPRPLDDKGSDLQRINSVQMSALGPDKLEHLREQLLDECRDICKAAEDTPLPPFRAVNHTIDLVDEALQYKWIPSRCPRAWKDHWDNKRSKYIASGRWEFKTGSNASPMMFIAKKPGPTGEARMRTVVDKRAQNSNTVRRVSPLPNQEHILENTLTHPFRSLIDMRDAFEQIRVEPDHVDRTLFNTPEGTMVSLVMQQGDCNAVATFQTLMNHIFAPYLGVFMDVYLDDIIIYSDTVEEHLEHIRLVMNILRREKFYLTTRDKLQFFAKNLVILGHVIDEHGVKMDPKKVDDVLKWPVPTNKTLLAGFNGAVGYLAPNCYGIRVPMVTLSSLAGAKSIWHWGPSENRAFEEIKRTVNHWRDHHRVAPDYSKNAAPFNLGTDASLMGGAGTLSQGLDIETAHIIGFWSGKFNSAQQNYPVHERELLAIVESIKRFRHLLQGVHFRVYTDHRPLEHLLSQPNLSARQHRWMDFLSDFHFEIIYIPGKANILPDALSRIYCFDSDQTTRSNSEFIEDNDNPNAISINALTRSAEQVDLSDVRKTRSSTNSLPKAIDRRDAVEAAVLPLTERARAKLQQRDSKGKGRGSAATSKVAKSTSSATAETIAPEPAPAPVSQLPDLANNLDQNIMDFDPILEVSDSSSDMNDTTPPSGGRESPALLAPVQSKLADIVSLSDPEMKFPSCLRHRYVNDKFFANVISDIDPLELATHKGPVPRHSNFQLDSGYLLLEDSGIVLLCIPDILVGKRRLREILISQAHSLLAHLGSRKTTAYLRESFWWPQMSKDVHDYCASCTTCATSKPTTQQPYGLLRSLQVPSRPWQQIGMDFVGPLPLSKNRHDEFDMICCIVCHLTSMVHLVPMIQTYKAKDIAELLFDCVYKLHGLPEKIVSDRDSYFTSTFWSRLHELIGVDLRMSTAYHPQTDGLTERTNRTVGQMLRQCVSLSQKDWAIKLPMIEYALNSARSDASGFSPFFLNTGRRAPPMSWHIMPEEIRGVRIYAQRLQDALISAHDVLIERRVKSTITANKKRRPSPFRVGDLVYLSTVNLSLPKGRSRKLSPKFVGPFLIEKEIVPKTTYRIALPSELKQKGIHPVFHCSLMRIHLPNDDSRFPGRAINSLPGFGDSADTWVVHNILHHAGVGEATLFEVSFKSGSCAWLPYAEIRHTRAFSDYLEAQGADSITSLPRGSAVPPDDPEINPSSINVADADKGVSSTLDLEDSLSDSPHLRISVLAMNNNGEEFIDYNAGNNPANPGVNPQMLHGGAFLDPAAVPQAAFDQYADRRMVDSHLGTADKFNQVVQQFMSQDANRRNRDLTRLDDRAALLIKQEDALLVRKRDLDLQEAQLKADLSKFEKQQKSLKENKSSFFGKKKKLDKRLEDERLNQEIRNIYNHKQIPPSRGRSHSPVYIRSPTPDESYWEVVPKPSERGRPFARRGETLRYDESPPRQRHAHARDFSRSRAASPTDSVVEVPRPTPPVRSKGKRAASRSVERGRSKVVKRVSNAPVDKGKRRANRSSSPMHTVQSTGPPIRAQLSRPLNKDGLVHNSDDTQHWDPNNQELFDRNRRSASRSTRGQVDSDLESIDTQKTRKQRDYIPKNVASVSGTAPASVSATALEYQVASPSHENFGNVDHLNNEAALFDTSIVVEHPHGWTPAPSPFLRSSTPDHNPIPGPIPPRD